MLFGQYMLQIPRNIHKYPQGFQFSLHLWVWFHTNISSLFLLQANIDFLVKSLTLIQILAYKHRIYSPDFSSYSVLDSSCISPVTLESVIFLFVSLLQNVVFGSMNYLEVFLIEGSLPPCNVFLLLGFGGFFVPVGFFRGRGAFSLTLNFSSWKFFKEN